MHVATTPRRPRGAFTLIELIVVIAIISVIMSLTLVAVMKFLGKGPEAQNRIEIGQLELALAQFRSENGFKVEYVPSRMRLYQNLSSYNTDTSQLAKDSKIYLEQMFGRHFFTHNTTVDWDNDPATNGVIDLEGQECLVFFLGGRLERSGALVEPRGFSTSHNPMAAGGARKGPFYQFKAARLVKLPTSSYYSYKDVYDTPFAFFSAKPDGYSNDCTRLTGNMGYYASNPAGAPMYTNPVNLGGYQIISAGPDKRWGNDRIFPDNGIPAGDAADNQANFSGRTFRHGKQ